MPINIKKLELKRSIILLILVMTGCANYAKTECKDLTAYDCRHSLVCALDCKVDPARPYACQSKYFCREKLNECEKNIRQAELDSNVFEVEKCQAKKGCFVEKKGCYCECEERPNSGCACACGGGPPTNCSEK